MSPRSDPTDGDKTNSLDLPKAVIQSNKVQVHHLFEEMSQRSDQSHGDKTNSLDLAKALEAEIQSKMPNDFGFVIHDSDDSFDSSGFDGCKRGRIDGEIFLSREFDGEKIMVKVEKPDFSRFHYRRNRIYSSSSRSPSLSRSLSRSSSSSSSRSPIRRPIRRLNRSPIRRPIRRLNHSPNRNDGSVSDADPLKLVVQISKKEGGWLSFNVSAAGNVTVDSMRIKEPSDNNYSEEYKVEMNSNLQGALREFLKARGIEKSTTDYLYDYMLRKYKKKPEIVLKKVLKFLED